VDGAIEGPYALVQQFEVLLAATEGQNWLYPWLPAGAARAAACLVCAGVLRPSGRFKEALVHLQRGNAAVDKELARQNISLEVCLLKPHTAGDCSVVSCVERCASWHNLDVQSGPMWQFEHGQWLNGLSCASLSCFVREH
jgi:hypothetical protein